MKRNRISKETRCDVYAKHNGHCVYLKDPYIISEREYNYLKDSSIVVSIEDDEVKIVSDNMPREIFIKDNIKVYFDNLHLSLKNSLITITEIKVHETVRELPCIGKTIERQIVKMVFEVIPEYTFLNFE